MLLNQRVAKIEPKKHFKEFVWCTVSSPGAEDKFYAYCSPVLSPAMWMYRNWTSLFPRRPMNESIFCIPESNSHLSHYIDRQSALNI